ncbi:hypothetical protein, partial [Nocardioides sp.]|uniref:hypothetical protein n=1 Tax=Nocardioides sp. TaxID=35761 RepID=UPI003567C2B3
MITRRPRLRSLAIIPAVVAGLTISTLPATASSGAPPSPSARVAAPAAAASATGFSFNVRNDPQPLCSAPSGTGSSATADPSIDRNTCVYAIFVGTGITTLSDLTGELYAEGADTPFATASMSERTQTPGSYQASFSPDESWAGVSGKVRLVIKFAGVEAGEFPFFYNNLVAADVAVSAPTSAPGDPFTVTGTIEEHVGGGPLVARDTGVPATYTVSLVKPDGTVVFTTAPATAASDGAFTAPIPAGTTAGLTTGAESNYKLTLGVRVNATFDDPDSSSGLPGQAVTGAWSGSPAGTTSHSVVTPASRLHIENSFVSSVGWVKPGETYPSRV